MLTQRELRLLAEAEDDLARDRRLARRLVRHRVGPRWWGSPRMLAVLLAVLAVVGAAAVVAGWATATSTGVLAGAAVWGSTWIAAGILVARIAVLNWSGRLR
ncbi:DUF3040 domain-containing protein [Kitasatospora sp. DSM 101779]|uniref:DUF3040 domain-containing protein n=1 Tax=Kitasatospora sp. DSM 101779 TaxID=2853165 RepID=UPI0021D94F61|nr:DUF3040 domain-containing protein [Kitasatospora sp. DSM 101779]MCU7826407.1 DUF3040 domain-containing protein [Kitasatospora sp. DSM 101779]